jgi:hypothetical protein
MGLRLTQTNESPYLSPSQAGVQASPELEAGAAVKGVRTSGLFRQWVVGVGRKYKNSSRLNRTRSQLRA